jgi:hypothetical protein
LVAPLAFSRNLNAMLGDGGDEVFELGYVATLDAANGLAGRARLPGLVVGLASRFFGATELMPELADEASDADASAAGDS